MQNVTPHSLLSLLGSNHPANRPLPSHLGERTLDIACVSLNDMLASKIAWEDATYYAAISDNTTETTADESAPTVRPNNH